MWRRERDESLLISKIINNDTFFPLCLVSAAKGKSSQSALSALISTTFHEIHLAEVLRLHGETFLSVQCNCFSLNKLSTRYRCNGDGLSPLIIDFRE